MATIRLVIMIHLQPDGFDTTRIDFLSNKYIPPRKSWDLTHVLALELLRLSM